VVTAELSALAGSIAELASSAAGARTSLMSWLLILAVPTRM
jgi:hypothetical protein